MSIGSDKSQKIERERTPRPPTGALETDGTFLRLSHEFVAQKWVRGLRSTKWAQNNEVPST